MMQHLSFEDFVVAPVPRFNSSDKNGRSRPLDGAPAACSSAAAMRTAKLRTRRKALGPFDVEKNPSYQGRARTLVVRLEDMIKDQVDVACRIQRILGLSPMHVTIGFALQTIGPQLSKGGPWKPKSAA